MGKVERWLPVRGFPGYTVSDMGRVRGPQKMLSCNPTHADGRLRVVLYRRGKKYTRLVYRLVLEAFVGPCPPGHEARHYPDNDRSNNRLSNLSWSTHLVNANDMVRHGTVNPSRLSNGRFHKKEGPPAWRA